MISSVRNGLIRLLGGRPASPALSRQVRLVKVERGGIEGSYDAAKTNEFNARYWSNADTLSPDEANSPEVRATLRSRARYECLESNSILKGIVHTLANDVIGTGPRLQMRTPDKEFNRQFEALWHRWAREIHLARKLRTMKLARTVDGEAFGQIITNRKLKHAIKVDLKPFEAEMCTTPSGRLKPNSVDGIVFDDDGNPQTYHILKSHPGGPWGGSLDKADRPAEVIIHLFRQDRPGQHRGIPEVTPALPLSALARDYTLSVVHAARSAAKFTAVLETAAARTDDGESFDAGVEAFDMVDVDYDMITSLPHGWKMNQFKAEQPTTTYDMFHKSLVSQCARCVHMPYNIAAANSSGYNYSSGRLDHQQYFYAIDVEQSEWEVDCLDRLLEAFADEALLIPDLLPAIGALEDLPHEWMWPGRPHVDPAKEAQGQRTRLSSGTTHRAREYAEQGLDVDVEDAIAAETFGKTVPEYRRDLFASLVNQQQTEPSNADEQDSEREESDEETAAASAA